MKAISQTPGSYVGPLTDSNPHQLAKPIVLGFGDTLQSIMSKEKLDAKNPQVQQAVMSANPGVPATDWQTFEKNFPAQQGSTVYMPPARVQVDDSGADLPLSEAQQQSHDHQRLAAYAGESAPEPYNFQPTRMTPEARQAADAKRMQEGRHLRSHLLSESHKAAAAGGGGGPPADAQTVKLENGQTVSEMWQKATGRPYGAQAEAELRKQNPWFKEKQDAETAAGRDIYRALPAGVEFKVPKAPARQRAIGVEPPAAESSAPAPATAPATAPPPTGPLKAETPAATETPKPEAHTDADAAKQADELTKYREELKADMADKAKEMKRGRYNYYPSPQARHASETLKAVKAWEDLGNPTREQLKALSKSSGPRGNGVSQKNRDAQFVLLQLGGDAKFWGK
ncbi:MAG: hypothetical protein IPK13_08040 [Deltaproteobacteria bacterium]|nr:hypothetical protein [Deltaproteobacteria bacterium]